MLLAALPVALAGCGGGTEEPAAAELSGSQEATVEKQWRMDLEDELGFDSFDFEAAVNQAVVDCERTRAAQWKLDLALGGDLEGSATRRIGLKYSCPRVLDAFDAAYSEVAAAPSLSEYVCTLPTGDMSAQDLGLVRLACAD